MGIGERIKQKREELNITQLELANRMGYKSKAAICKVEKGEDNITSDRVIKFANALNVSVSYLMGWDDEPISVETPEERQNNLFEELVKSYERGFILDKYRKLPDEYKVQVDMMIETYYKLSIDMGKVKDNEERK